MSQHLVPSDCNLWYKTIKQSIFVTEVCHALSVAMHSVKQTLCKAQAQITEHA